jgi:hypothetical protein
MKMLSALVVALISLTPVDAARGIPTNAILRAGLKKFDVRQSGEMQSNLRVLAEEMPYGINLGMVDPFYFSPGFSDGFLTQKQPENTTLLKQIQIGLVKLDNDSKKYFKAELRNKATIHQQFIEQFKELSPKIAQLPQPLYYSLPLRDLERLVNSYTTVLAQREQFIQQQLVSLARTERHRVDELSLGEKILFIAPPLVASFVAPLSETQVAPLLIDGTEDSLVVYKNSEDTSGIIVEDLRRLLTLAPSQQEHLIRALFTGHNEGSSEQVALSSGGQVAIMALAINKLATKANLPEADLNVINEFANTLLSTTRTVAEGRAEFLSLGVEVLNAHGERELYSYHLDLKEFAKNPDEMMATLSLELLRIGVDSLTPFTVSYASQQQVEVLSALEGNQDQLLQGTSGLEELLNTSIVQTSSQLIPTSTDENATVLVSNTDHHLVDDAIREDELPIIAIEALACLKGTISKVLTDDVQEQLSLSDFIGTPLIFSDDEPQATFFPHIDANPEEDGYDEENPERINSQGQPNLVAPNEQLIATFKSVLFILDDLSKKLSEKYGDDSQIFLANQNVLKALRDALSDYETEGTYKTGDKSIFQAACVNAITDAKEVFDTHRDTGLTKWFKDIIERVSDFIMDRIFKPEIKEAQTARYKFFDKTYGQSERITRSAMELYKFNQVMNRSFEQIKEHDEEKGLDPDNTHYGL